MQVRKSYGLTLAMFVAAECTFTAAARAQSFVFPYSDAGGAHSYGLLNGDHLALYINDRGDLGAPYRNIGIEKPTTGKLNGIYAVVNPDGSVPNGPTPSTRYTYAALYSKTSTVGLPPVPGQTALQTSIQAKTEYVTVGNNALEAYGVYVPGQNATWLHNGDFSMDPSKPAFSVSGKQGGILSATSYVNNSTSGVSVAQTISIDDRPGDHKLDIANVAVTITNNSGGDLSGVRYARVFNPNMGAYSGTNSTVQSLGTPSDPTAFAINASVAARQMAVGIDPGTASAAGTTIFSTNIVQEDSLFSSLNNTLADSNRVVLGNGTTADYYLAGGVTPFATGSYLDSQFVSKVNFDSDPVDDSLVLISPSYDLASGQSFSFDFSYYFDPLQASGNPVPEPGAIALVSAAIAVAGTMVHRRRCARVSREMGA